MSTKSEAVMAKLSWVDSRGFERLLEAIPGLITWFFLLMPIILSFFAPIIVAYFIIAFDLIWLVKSLRLSFFLIIGYSKLRSRQNLNWASWLGDLENIGDSIENRTKELAEFKTRSVKTGPGRLLRRNYAQMLAWHIKELKKLDQAQVINPKELYNAVIVATYNETLETLEPSIQALTQVDYPLKRMMLVIAYEERGGSSTEANAKLLIKRYGSKFAYATAIKHPDGRPGEGRVKGANMSYAAREFTGYIRSAGIDPARVIVTSLDSDHRPHPGYFSYLTFAYASNPDRLHRSFQPVPMFYNNIWDAPGPMRMIATGSSFWTIMQMVRPHLLRNFAAHAQGLQSLVDTDYWHTTSIVEDGHQFWRSYFRYHGDHQVVPIFIPVYQDAVLARTYIKTAKVQYIQLRRWAWGISDFPYVVKHSIKDRTIKFSEKAQHLFRLMEGHFSWATAPIILTFVAWLPLYLNRSFAEEILAHQLPIIASRILSLAMLGMVVTVIISLISLPPRPARYRPTRSVAMLVQWLFLPFTAIVFSSFAAIDAQTRLMIGKYLDWKVTEKSTRT